MNEGLAERVLRLRAELDRAEEELRRAVGPRAVPRKSNGLQRRVLELARAGVVASRDVEAATGYLPHSCRAALSKLVAAGRLERVEGGVRAKDEPPAWEGLLC